MYTYLMAGLPELSLEFHSSEHVGGVKNFDYEHIIEHVFENIDKGDMKYLRFLLSGLGNPAPYFYLKAAKSKNSFIRQYFLLDASLRNIQAGIAARKTGQTPDAYLVGDDMTTEAIRTSKAGDFDLESEDLQRIVSIFGVSDIWDREQKLDLFRWEKVNEIAFFQYFNMDAVLAFVMKAFLVNRWMQLDKEKGDTMFRQLLKECRGASEYTKMPEK
ncbi:MAG: DUF2764 domain-containing protein [Bacteroidales bacterium]|nr:DUF2764 domain-containing protein [Bacteroidales bacterium]